MSYYTLHIRPALRLAATGLLALGLSAAAATAQTDPLPSWNDGAAKQAILDFVTRTTTDGSGDFVPPGERIAAFDQDDTLWVAQPIYTEFRFVMDRVPELVKAHLELAEKPAFAAILSKDEKRHDDAEREYPCGPADGLPDSSVGTFSQEIYDLGTQEGWVIVSMKNDWKQIFAFEE